MNTANLEQLKTLAVQCSNEIADYLEAEVREIAITVNCPIRSDLAVIIGTRLTEAFKAGQADR